MDSVLFWTVLAFSLSVGFIAAYPVNTWLSTLVVKEEMMNPKGDGLRHLTEVGG